MRSRLLSHSMFSFLFLSCYGAVAAQGSPEGVRWILDDEGGLWIPQSVALGDLGAAVAVGRWLNTPGFSLHAAGDRRPVWVFPPRSSGITLDTLVAAADRAPIVATLEIVQGGVPPMANITPTLSTYRVDGTGQPLWTFAFQPSRDNTFAALHVSGDGDTVMGVWSTENVGGAQLEAFRGDGSVISSGVVTFRIAPPLILSHADLSDDGRRALLHESVTAETVVYDVAAGREEFRVTSLPATFGGRALSGDGKRFVVSENVPMSLPALGQTHLATYERDQGGSWAEIDRVNFGREWVIRGVDLDHDGNRLAYALDRRNPRSIRIGAYDLDARQTLFEHDFTTTGVLPIDPAGVRIDDAGETVAGISWGDLDSGVPEIFVFDASGAVLRTVDAAGSGISLDLSADGDLLLVGTRKGHITSFLGFGGQVTLIETRRTGLHVPGQPRVGTSPVATIAVPGGVLAALGVATGVTPGPTRGLRLDLSGPYAFLPPIRLADGTAMTLVPIPSTPALVGLRVHWQAAVLMPTGAVSFSEQVALRILP